MTMPLETQYRRLLAFYPAEHRRFYEDEMIGVLMDSARPGQRHPATGEALSLLWSGLSARTGRGLHDLRGTGWRDAAAVTGLFCALVLACTSGHRVLVAVTTQSWGDSRLTELDAGGRAVLWLAVVIAALAGLRRGAAVLGVAALLAETASLLFWLPRVFLTLGADRGFDDPNLLAELNAFAPRWMSWLLLPAALTALLLLVARRGRTAKALLGVRGTVLLVGGVALAAAATAAIGRLGQIRLFDQIDLVAALVGVAVLMVVAGFWQAPRAVRIRILALCVPVLTVPVAHLLLEDGLYHLRGSGPGPVVVVGIIAAATLPAVALGAAATLVHLSERFAVTVRRRDAAVGT
jgi:hypothetical protein